MNKKTSMKKHPRQATAGKPSRKDPNVYPKGWNRKRAQALADYYDRQSDEEAIAEADAAYRSITVTMMAIPVELVPKVQKLLAKRAG